MFGIFSQKPIHLLMPETELLTNGGGGSYSGVINPTPAAVVARPSFDFDLSRINEAVRRGNTAEDIRSAYEVFTTGTSQGRGLGYAQDIQRRFSPGLISTYGSADIQTAAANYLDSAGLPRLAAFISPTPAPVTTPNPDDTIGDFFGLPPPPVTPTPENVTEKNPFEILADVLPKLFGNAVYNPPLQSQAYGYTPASSEQPLTQVTGGSNFGLLIVVGVVGAIGYFLYKRFAK